MCHRNNPPEYVYMYWEDKKYVIVLFLPDNCNIYSWLQELDLGEVWKHIVVKH